MTKTYTSGPCWVCKKPVTANGLGYTSHMRKHVREGVLIETKTTSRDGETFIHFTRPYREPHEQPVHRRR